MKSNNLTRNILKMYGTKGQLWLDNLPKRIQQLQLLWGLSQLRPCFDLSYHMVLEGMQHDKPIVLKIGFKQQGLLRESQALAAFKGYGVVDIQAATEDALLLEKACPGKSLKTVIDRQDRILIAFHVMQRLHKAPIPVQHNFFTIDNWLSTLDKNWGVPKRLLTKARQYKNELLLLNPTSATLLHGYLHDDNILSHENFWKVIDPKGVLGDPVYELVACVQEPSQDLPYLSQISNYPSPLLIKSYYVRLILSACWQCEDHLDPHPFSFKAEQLLRLFDSASH